MKARIFFMLVLLAALTLPSTFAQEVYEEDFVIPLSRPGQPGTLKVNFQNGDIYVTGYSGDKVEVHLVAKNQAEKRESEAPAPDGLKRVPNQSLDIKMSEEDNEVRINSRTTHQNREIKLEIKVPENFSMNLSSFNSGEMKVENVNGEIELSNHNGNILMNGISGAVVATCYNGKVTAIIKKTKPDTPMAFSSYNGDIDITFPPGLKATTKAKTLNGDIYTGFEVNLKKGEVKSLRGKDSGEYKIVVNEWTRMDINGGGPEFMFRTWNGNIFIRKGK